MSGKTFDEWIKEYKPHKIPSSFTLEDMREAFDMGQENSYMAEFMQRLYTEEAESHMNDIIEYENRMELLEKKLRNK